MAIYCYHILSYLEQIDAIRMSENIYTLPQNKSYLYCMEFNFQYYDQHTRLLYTLEMHLPAWFGPTLNLINLFGRFK